MPKVKLPDSGIEVEYKSMNWDDSEEYLRREASQREGETLGKLISEYVEKACPGIFEKIKGSRKDVLYLWRALIKETFGAPEEEKN